MKTWSNLTKTIIYTAIILFLTIAMTLSFVFCLKFDKKYTCKIQSIYNDEYLVTNKKVAQYLNQTKKQQVIEYKKIRYYFQYKFYKKIDENYLFITNLNIDLSNGTDCYILIENVNLFELIN